MVLEVCKFLGYLRFLRVKFLGVCIFLGVCKFGNVLSLYCICLAVTCIICEYQRTNFFPF